MFCYSNRERNHEYDYFDKVIEYEYDSSKMAYDYTRVRFLSTITPSLIAAYQHSLDTELCNIEVSDVMHCKSMHCKNNIHINHIEELIC